MTVVYLRNVGTEEDACWVVCAKGDAGAVEFSDTKPRSQPEPSANASGSYMGTGSAYWNKDLEGR